MGHDGKDEVMVCETGASGCSEATVEIKIKTLDSQTYTLRVDKRVPVPALKEQIATVTGVLSDQQRLICRGKVLKDDQLLSAYHVEDGHTLHMVVRQPIPLLSETSDSPAADLASSAGDSQGSQRARVVMGSFNIADQEDGAFPDLNQIISAVLGTMGITNSEGGGVEVVDDMGSLSEGLSRQSGSRTAGDSVRGQSGQENGANQNTNAWNPMQPPVIPDSLTTLSECLNNLRREFIANGVNENTSQASGNVRSNVQEPDVAPRRSGLPGPTQLAEVLRLARQLLVSEVAECLSSLSRQVEDHVNVADPSARTHRQLTVLQSGVLLESLGASLLELGRTTMMLRLGQTADEAVVHAGPAVFISPSGPNPIMVQPHPSRLGISSFGAAPIGNVQPNSMSGGSRGSGPRNIEIRIRAGSWMPSSGVNQRGGATPQPAGETNSAASSVTNSSTTSVRGISDTTRSPVALVIPVVGRYQQSSGGPDAAQQQNSGFSVDNNVGTQMPNGRGLSELRNRINQLLRPVGVNPGNLDSQNTVDSSAISADTNETSVNTAQETAPATSEGNLVASMLQQIMPLISQNLASSSTVGAAAEMENSNSRQASPTQERGSGSSSRRSEKPSPPDAKRQKRE